MTSGSAKPAEMSINKTEDEDIASRQQALFDALCTELYGRRFTSSEASSAVEEAWQADMALLQPMLSAMSQKLNFPSHPESFAAHPSAFIHALDELSSKITSNSSYFVSQLVEGLKDEYGFAYDEDDPFSRVTFDHHEFLISKRKEEARARNWASEWNTQSFVARFNRNKRVNKGLDTIRI